LDSKKNPLALVNVEIRLRDGTYAGRRGFSMKVLKFSRSSASNVRGFGEQPPLNFNSTTTVLGSGKENALRSLNDTIKCLLQE